MPILTTLCNFEYFGGELRRMHENYQKAQYQYSDQYSDEQTQLPTRVIRVLAEVYEDISEYQKCMSKCPCGMSFNMQEQQFYVDFLSYPALKLYCSLKCTQEYIKKDKFVTLNGDSIQYNDQIRDYDIQFGSLNAIPNMLDLLQYDEEESDDQEL